MLGYPQLCGVLLFWFEYPWLLSIWWGNPNFGGVPSVWMEYPQIGGGAHSFSGSTLSLLGIPSVWLGTDVSTQDELAGFFTFLSGLKVAYLQQGQ